VSLAGAGGNIPTGVHLGCAGTSPMWPEPTARHSAYQGWSADPKPGTRTEGAPKVPPSVAAPQHRANGCPDPARTGQSPTPRQPEETSNRTPAETLSAGRIRRSRIPYTSNTWFRPVRSDLRPPDPPPRAPRAASTRGEYDRCGAHPGWSGRLANGQCDEERLRRMASRKDPTQVCPGVLVRQPSGRPGPLMPARRTCRPNRRCASTCCAPG
jgi:hypothetical protein